MITTIPDPEDVKQAICYRCDNCWNALSLANALGGSRTKAWDLAHKHTLEELIAHAREADIDLAGLVSAVHSEPIEETIAYRRATGAITEAEYRAEFSRWRRGDVDR